MSDYIRELRGVECIVEYTVEDNEICIFDVYPLNEDGTKGNPFELTEEENNWINEECWHHYYDYSEPNDYELH